MNIKNAAYIFSGFATLALLSGCGGNAFSPIGGQSSGGQPIPFVAQVPVLLTTTNSVSNQSLNSQNVENQALPPGSGTVYYAYIGNASNATANLTVTSYSFPSSSVVESPVWTRDPVIPNLCKNMPPGDERCALPVAVNANNIESSAQFTTIMTVNYSNGTSSQIPLAVNLIESSESGIVTTIPSPVVTNESGFASGIISVFNAGSSSYSITESNIFPSPQQPGWTFTLNCNGTGSSVILPNSSCTIFYTYHAPPASPPPTSVSLQWTNISESNAPVVTSTTPSSTIVPPPVTPVPYLTYPAGGVVSVASGSGTILLQNLGNAPLASVIPNVVPGLVINTSACNNLAPGATCLVQVTAANPASVQSATVVLTPSSGSPAGGVSVAVAGQSLGLTPSVLNFGTGIYGGTTLSQQITVTNLGATSLSGFTVTPGAVDPSYSLSGCGGSVLAPFTSCTITVVYTAPNTTSTESGAITVTANLNSPVPATFTATSKPSTWINMLSGAISPYIANHVVPLVNGNESNLFFGVSPTSNVQGPRNVWSILNTLPAGQPVNLTGSLPGWSNVSTGLPSAPTALAYTGSIMFVGTFYGDVKACGSESCTSLVTGVGSVGVTSLVSLASNGFASFSDSSSGTTGSIDLVQNWATSPNVLPVAGITAAVGKMATDGVNVYAPLGNRQLAVINSSGVVTNQNIAPSALLAGEYPTVVYINGTSMWIGTSKGYVYKSTAASPAATTSATWTSVAGPLNGPSIVSALGLTNLNNLYAGTATLGNPATGGGVFVQNNSTGTFTASTGYTDYSSVSSINIDNNGDVEAATYAGNIWQFQP